MKQNRQAEGGVDSRMNSQSHLSNVIKARASRNVSDSPCTLGAVRPSGVVRPLLDALLIFRHALRNVRRREHANWCIATHIDHIRNPSERKPSFRWLLIAPLLPREVSPRPSRASAPLCIAGAPVVPFAVGNVLLLQQPLVV